MSDDRTYIEYLEMEMRFLTELVQGQNLVEDQARRDWLNAPEENQLEEFKNYMTVARNATYLRKRMQDLKWLIREESFKHTRTSILAKTPIRKNRWQFWK